MTIPSVSVTKQEGQLNITPGAGSRLLAITGPTTKGTAAQFSVQTRVTTLIATFGYGKAVRAAAYAIANYGAVLFGKCATTTAGTAGAVAHVGTGASIMTVDTVVPTDDHDIVITIVTGGTVAAGSVTGATYKLSIDGGKNTSAVKAFTLASGGKLIVLYPDGTSTLAEFDFADGTLVAGDTYSVTTVSPACTGTDADAIVTALTQTQINWEILEFASTVDATIAAKLDALITARYAQGRGCLWISDHALMTSAQTDAQFQTAATGVFGSYASTGGVGTVCGSPCQIVQQIPTQASELISPASMAVAPLIQSLPIHKSPAQPINSNVLPGVSLTDVNGMPAARTHNEELFPGLDDARFLTLRTWGSAAGIYVCLPKTMAAVGSDFDRIPKLRVYNRAFEILWAFFKRRIQLEVRVNATTGHILEADANEIEKKATDAVKELLSAPSASAVQVTVARDDNLISSTTPTLTVTGSIVPLGYPDKIQLNLGFEVSVVKV